MGLLRNPLKSFIISAWLHPNVAFPGNVPLSNLVYGSCQCVLLDKMMHCMSSERRMSLSVTNLGSPAGAAAEGSAGDLRGTPHAGKLAASGLSQALLLWQQLEVIGLKP